jgi:biopolymer transport protein ExbD
MITYLIYSTISLAALLIFYHLFLEREKMHQINRGFLIFSLLFSLSIPLIPVGLDISPIEFFSFGQETVEGASETVLLDGEWYDSENEAIVETPVSASSRVNYFYLALLVYILGAFSLFVRLLRIIYMIQLKADRNKKRLYHGFEIVLLNEDVIPHTFMNSIFLNKEKYLSGEIPEEVMIHELTHVSQKHTLDVLLIELLKIIFWFNPILYLYKKAILLNHEFLADEAVIAHGAEVKSYQSMLLNSLVKSPAYSLVNTFNFSLTKKRLQMMTKSKSAFRSVLKVIALIPLLATIMLLPGCESTTFEYTDEREMATEMSIQITNIDALLVNGKVMTLSELDSYFSDLAEAPNVVYLRVDPNATFGTITDVQTMLRKHEALRINYSTQMGKGIDELERVTNEFLKAAARYMEIEPGHPNYEELKARYEELSEFYESIRGVEVELPPLPPPPPPMPPSPEERMMDDSSPEVINTPSPPSPVEARNMMQILMNSQGMLLMNEEPAAISDVKERIRDFVSNRGADPNLSESPVNAIVSIKTVPRTPYDTYLELLEEVATAYNELRDEAAIDQFGMPFSSLGADSYERDMIKEIYPMRISIREPEKS